jgi:DNA gyrase/topoisomerase IV subunit B
MNNFLQLVDINDIIETKEYVNMVDISVDDDSSFMLSNGIISHNSASGAFRKYRTPETMGAFSLLGKFINVSDISNQKLIQNKEAVGLMASIGLKLGKEINLKDLRYGRILFYTDADFDGNAISALLINFLYKYWPEMFDKKMVYKVETPIMVVVPKSKTKTKKKVIFYTQGEYNKWCEVNDLKNFEVKYKKGLAALVDDEYDDIINNPRLTLLTKDNKSLDNLEVWFGKSSDLRKIELLR